MQNHRGLRVYQAAQCLAHDVYQASTMLPPHERFALGDQLRRAAISVGSNIAEGCGRSTARDFACYLDKSLGSAKEVEFQMRHADAEGMVPRPLAQRAIARSITIQSMLASLIEKVRQGE